LSIAESSGSLKFVVLVLSIAGAEIASVMKPTKLSSSRLYQQQQTKLIGQWPIIKSPSKIQI